MNFQSSESTERFFFFSP